MRKYKTENITPLLSHHHHRFLHLLCAHDATISPPQTTVLLAIKLAVDRGVRSR